DLAGPTAAKAVPIVPVGVRVAIGRAIGSTIAVQTPVTKRAPIAIQTPVAQGAIAPIAIQ
ncbi:hypothetical protein Y956_06011, partial [Nipponia nippon]